MTFVEQLSQYAGPRVVAPGWAVRIDVHYLGGLRHFYGWEIADIGVMVFAKQSQSLVAKKVALLQSKRLYPDNGVVNEESPEDYRIGLGNLLPSQSAKSLALTHTFKFTADSKYRALKVGDHQYQAIEKYEEENDLDVHYLLYNPWKVPSSYTFPVQGSIALGPKGNGGCRVVRADALRKALSTQANGYSPSFKDIAGAFKSQPPGDAGWRVENFISNLLLKCKEGTLFESLDQENIFNLFNRRSGPIAAAVAVTVEQFEGR
ncbi:hypothetical protein H8N03_25775 [Ramlibacter sp. USB13]|uniref:Uncharacterized protein n=1 Tax=Ramlibacter cellulosilyticus TaxID=2764187 RepID=A0A923SEK2_9BURK|nr:hypothetical protein [Ramlibacter cellulosilyticus]MBC5786373.1 hypothetical protein [Ramlibacter cellulosilyticus]